MRGFVGRATALACAAFAATAWFSCRAGPSAASMTTSPVCHVWTNDAFGPVSASVSGNAQVHGAFGKQSGAYFVGDSKIQMPGAASSWTATYAERTLMIHGLRDIGPATLGTRSATVHGLGGTPHFQWNERCSDRDAALGITSLVVFMIASSEK